MLAFFSIIVDPQGSYQCADGTLHNPPAELRDNFRIGQYLKIARDGWTSSEFGYLCLRQTDRSGHVYIIPALYLKDGPKPTKRFDADKPQFNKKTIENYLNTYLERNAAHKLMAEREMTSLVHDLRNLSSAIYHSAEEADTALQNKNYGDLGENIKTIIATQTMLKVRIDYLDFCNGVNRFEQNQKIPVYSRVDKVVRCFTASARHKTIKLSIRGQSYRNTEGPNILDIIPYTIIENALKYAPKNSEVIVEVHDTDRATMVSVSSLGPIVTNEEVSQIFERGFRGKFAAKLQPEGTGIGLSVAKEIVELFKGTISVDNQDEKQTFDDIEYQNIKFTFFVPTSGENTSKKKRSTRPKNIQARKRRLG